jgi:polyribonucleotide nucleotidyltransferase
MLFSFLQFVVRSIFNRSMRRATISFYGATTHFALLTNNEKKMQNQEILELANLRIDGRQFHQIRQLKHKIGVMPSADGSAYFEHGLNKVLVIVNGPQEMRKRSDTNDEKA